MRDGDEYVINGSKTFISNGLNCDLVIVVVQDRPDATGAKAMSLIAGRGRSRRVSAAAASSTRSASTPHDTAELFFDDVRVPVTQPCSASEGKGCRT